MKAIFLLIFIYFLGEIQANQARGPIHFPAEKRLRNVRQLTFGGYNLNARLSPNGRYVVYAGNYADCFQIYRIDLCKPEQPPFRISSGLGDYISANFYPDNQQLLLATNFHHYLPVGNSSQIGRCYHSMNSKNPLNYFRHSRRNMGLQKYMKFDLFKVNNLGNIRERLTKNNSYTEAALSPDGKWVAFFDRENETNGNQLYLMKEDGSGERKRLTRTVGNKDMPSFSNDGSKITFYANNHETKMKIGQKKISTDIYTVRLDDGTLQKVTDLGDQSATPFYHSNNRQLFFSSNYNREPKDFDIYLVDEDGKNLEKITFNDNGFDYFPTFSANGSKLLWSSSRNGSGNEVNLFISDFVNENSTTSTNSLNCPNNEEDLPNSSRDQLKRLKQMDKIHFPDEKHLQNVQQLTFGGQNAEGYFGSDSKRIVLQAAGDLYGTKCDQIYTLRVDQKVDEETQLQKLSTGLGACTCSYLFPDGKTSIHASTFASVTENNFLDSCPPKKCQSQEAKTDPLLKKLCNTSYTWDLHPDYDIYKVNEYGNIIKRLTSTYGYDAEGAISPDGKQIVFTSMRSGDPELWLIDANGSNLRQLTNEVGYDGGPFFSPDGKKISFRASRPKDDELTKYKQLLSYNLVEPLAMELYTINVDGTGLRKITDLGGSNWAPFYLNDNRRIVFSTNFNATGRFGQFDLYMIADDGTGIERLTYNEPGFDAFPMI